MFISFAIFENDKGAVYAEFVSVFKPRRYVAKLILSFTLAIVLLVSLTILEYLTITDCQIN